MLTLSLGTIVTNAITAVAKHGFDEHHQIE